MFIDNRIAIAELRRKINIARQISQNVQSVLGNKPGMPGRASAIIITLFTSRICSNVMFNPPSFAVPSSKSCLPRMASSNTVGWSKNLFKHKILKPALLRLGLVQSIA